MYKKGTYFLPNKRRVSADPQFSAQRASEGVNRSVVFGLTHWFRRVQRCTFLLFRSKFGSVLFKIFKSGNNVNRQKSIDRTINQLVVKGKKTQVRFDRKKFFLTFYDETTWKSFSRRKNFFSKNNFFLFLFSSCLSIFWHTIFQNLKQLYVLLWKKLQVCSNLLKLLVFSYLNFAGLKILGPDTKNARDEFLPLSS